MGALNRTRRAVIRLGLGAGVGGLWLVTGCALHSRFLSTRVARIGGLWSLPADDPLGIQQHAVLIDGLRDLGWVEGENLAHEWRFTDGSEERLREAAAELVHMKVDVIVTGASRSTAAAKQATETIPIVISSIVDPVGAGLVSSLAHPGGNVTGTSDLAVELVPKQVEFLHLGFPGASRLGILWTPLGLSGQALFAASLLAADKAGLDVRSLEVRRPEDLTGVLDQAVHERIDSLLVVSDTLFVNNRFEIVAFAAQQRLPAMYGGTPFTKFADGLMSYTRPALSGWRLAATYVDKILRGARPGDLPIENPRGFEFAVNVKTAQALNWSIPLDVAAQVTEWIE
jgi:putative ABC transport system substrate-binding protein